MRACGQHIEATEAAEAALTIWRVFFVSRKKCRAKIAICILFFCYCLGEDFHLAVGKSGQACKAREKYKGEETPLAQIPGA